MGHLFAGGYAEPGGRGLVPLRLTTAALVAGRPMAPFVNVSAGVRRPGTDRWYLVDEKAGLVRVADADDEWRELASFSSGGEAPCHLAPHPSGRLLAVANYGSGTVGLFHLGADGIPLGPATVHQNQGSGPNAERQEGPHAHWVGFAPNGRLYVADLGTDQILAFDVEPTSGRLGNPKVVYAAPPGSGPRQLAFHPAAPVAFLVSELASTLTVLNVAANGALSARAILSTLPDDAKSRSLGGAILLNPAGTRLYVTNRGHDSVASFAIDADGVATLLGHTPSGGKSPRFLLLWQDRLLVAHEQTGGVTMLALERDGVPQPPVARADVRGAAFLGVTGG